ncbi:MAG TPA: class I SAM-dependent methyltransferase [Candidatus Acidoferrales bacterium]|nr:class I SAM-dependent methyltransferase [Candidatus Acidoferrales bacterium]
MPPEISEAEVAEHWDRNAPLWAEQVRRGHDIFREHWNNPAFVEFAGDLRGKNVLDAGCGEGYNTRIFARRGARMTGVDLSHRMLELALEEERREPLGIRYVRASFTDLAIFHDATFDAVVSTMALMDGPDLARAMREIARVMRCGAMLAFNILHPCFVTKGMGWVNDEKGEIVKWGIADYFNDEPWVSYWKFGHAPNAEQVEDFGIPRFDRTLADYINSTIAAGLQLAEIREPRAPESACAAFPDSFLKWRKHVPLFLHVRASKP